MVEIDLEELREQIEQIQKGVDTINESGINETALYVLVQHSIGNYRGRKIPIHIIRTVFGGFEELQEFVFPEIEDVD